MSIFWRKATISSNAASTAVTEQPADEHAADEHAIWGVGGPGFLSAALLDELSHILAELPCALDLPESAATAQQV